MNTENLRKASQELIDADETAAGIAKAIGTSKQNFGRFLGGGGLGEEKKKRLEAYLKAQGKTVEPLPDFCDVVASELFNLAAILSSQLPGHIKAAKFRSQIEGYVSCMTDFVDALRLPDVSSHKKPPVKPKLSLTPKTTRKP
jgi:hypothetical protein